MKRDIYPWLLWLALILHGSVFITTTAIWDGFDEPLHYGYIQHIAEHGSLPVYGKTILAREVTRSFEVAPLSPAFNSILGSRYTTFVAYWQLPETERMARVNALRAIGREERSTPDLDLPVVNYEAHQAPLFYLVAAPIYWMCTSLDLPTRVACLRFFALLLGSLTVFAAYAAAQRSLSSPAAARGVAFTVALMPMFPCTIARISNDSLAVPLGGIAVFLMMDYVALVPSRRRAAWIGVVLGLGMLSKAYFIALLAAAVATFGTAAFFSADRKRLLRHLGIVLALASAIAGWWYVRNFILYGNLSGLQEVTLTGNLPLGERLALIGKVPWLAAWHGFFKQHIWLGNMSLLELSRALYDAGYALILAAILGFACYAVTVVRGWPGRTSHALREAFAGLDRQTRALGIAAISYGFFLLAAAYHMWQNFILVGRAGGTGGYYLYAVIVPELVLLVFGLNGFPGRIGKLAQRSLILYVVLIDFVALFCKLVPYYGGMSIPRFHLRHLFEVYTPSVFQMILARITAPQSAWLSPSLLAGLMFCHLAWMIVMVCTLSRADSQPS